MYKIYCLINTVNDKVYIGYTKNTLQWRWRRHYEHAKYNPKTHIQFAIRKYGREAFQCFLVDNADTLEAVKILEKKYIGVYESNNPDRGYNLTDGGEGYEVNESVREKMRASQKGVQACEQNAMARKDLNRAEIVRLYETGLSTKEIGVILESGDETIRRRLVWENVPRRNRLQSSSKEDIARLYKAGFTGVSISRKLGLDKSTVYRFIKRKLVGDPGFEPGSRTL